MAPVRTCLLTANSDKMRQTDKIPLNDGSGIPQLGFGCFQVTNAEIETVMRWAVEAGYRYFDAATRYENEAGVGNGLRGSGVPREELYVVGKMWPSSFDDPVRAIEYSLRQLNLEYIDSYYLHWPSSSEARRFKAWEAMLKYREKGLVRSVGVSNFTRPQLEGLIRAYGVTPVVNQIELHPWYPQTDLCGWCRQAGMAVTAWGPIFRGCIDEVPLLTELGERYGKTPAQVTLRWHLQHGNVVIPKSSSRDRILSNTKLYDFELSAEDMAQIDALECGRHFGDDPNTNDGGNFHPEGL